MSARRAIALNTAIQFAGKIITAASSFFTTLVLARAFGLTGYGEFTKITTYIAFYLLLIDFGLNAVALPLVKSYGERMVFSHLFFLRLFFGIILASLAPLLALLLPYNSFTSEGFSTITKLGILVLSATIIFQGMFLSTNAIFQKHLRYDQSVIAASLGNLVGLLALIIVVFIHGNLLLALAALSLSWVIMALTSLFLVRQFIETISLTFSLPLFQALFRGSLPLGLTLVFNLVYLRANTFILSTTRSTLEVGIFGLAYKFFEFILTLPTFFMNSVYPVFVERRDNVRELQKTILKAGLFLLISSVVFLGLGFFAAPLLVFVKDEFVASVVPFRILIIALPFFFLSSLFMWLLIALEKRRQLLVIYGSVMVVSIFMNLLFVPRFGYLAAAVISGVNEALAFLFAGHFALQALRDQHD